MENPNIFKIIFIFAGMENINKELDLLDSYMDYYIDYIISEQIRYDRFRDYLQLGMWYYDPIRFESALTFEQWKEKIGIGSCFLY